MCSDKLLNADLHNNPFTATCHTYLLTNSVSPGPDSIWIIQPITRLSSLNRVPDWSMLCSLQMSHAIPDWRVSVCANAWVEKQLRKHEQVTDFLQQGILIGEAELFLYFGQRQAHFSNTRPSNHLYCKYIFLWLISTQHGSYWYLNSYAIIVHIFAADVFP